MQTLGINENNDIFLDAAGNICIKKDQNAMGDIYVNKVQTLKNELLYSDKGIDYFNTIFSSPTYPDLFQNELTNELLNTESTISIDSFDGEVEQDVYKYTAQIQTEFGEVYLNG